MINLETFEVREVGLPVSHGRLSHAWMNGNECRVTRGWNNSVTPGINESNEVVSYSLNGFAITYLRTETNTPVYSLGTDTIITPNRTYSWNGLGHLQRSNNSPVNFVRLGNTIPFPSRYSRAFKYKNEDYLVGGAEDVNGVSDIRKVIRKFNPSNETFSIFHTLRMEQAAHGTVVDGEWVYFFGGIAYSSITNNIRNIDLAIKKEPPNMVVRFNMVTKVEEVVSGWDFLPIAGFVNTFKIDDKLIYVHSEGAVMYDWKD